MLNIYECPKNGLLTHLHRGGYRFESYTAQVFQGSPCFQGCIRGARAAKIGL